MKTIGLLGGMSWESTEVYYRMINRGVQAHLGGLHSAKIVLVSVDFEEIEKLQSRGEWEQAGDILAKAGKQVEAGGADFLLICTNTMHKVADAIQSAIHIPILHIADATAEYILHNIGMEEHSATSSSRHRRVRIGLLGTLFTMEQDFYRGRLEDKYGLEIIVPPEKDRKIVHQIIYQELCLGQIKEDSRREYLRIIDSMVSSEGVEGVIEGCTEIGILVKQEHTSIPLFDTTAIHVKAAIKRALETS